MALILPDFILMKSIQDVETRQCRTVKPGVYSTRKRDHRGCDAAMQFPQGCIAR